jgi:hypothetical protein
MLGNISKFFVAAGAAATIATGALIPAPAAASTQDTINTILDAAAIVGGIVLYNDFAQEQQADVVCGYTTNGGRVYGDGRIVMPDGRVFYPGQYNGGQYVYDGGWRRNDAFRQPAPQYRAPAPAYREPAPAYRAQAPQFRQAAPVARDNGDRGNAQRASAPERGDRADRGH